MKELKGKTYMSKVYNQLKLLFLSVFILMLVGCNTVMQTMDKGAIPVVDTHIHLYDLKRLPGLPWPEKKDKVLYRSVFAEEYNKVIAKNNLSGVIVVEASPRVSDNDWVLYHTEKYADKYVGLIGALEFDKETFKDDFKRLCEHKRFLGLRIGTQYLDKPDKENYMKDPVVLANIQRVSDAGKALDVLLLKSKLTIDHVIFMAQKYPQLKLVINNIDSVITSGKDQQSEARRKIKEAASFPNVYCKVTSLVHKCSIDPEAKDMAYFTGELKRVLEDFGEDRIIYGSNWPCIIKIGDFSDHFKVINDYFSARGRRVLEKLYYKNAEKVYGFKLK